MLINWDDSYSVGNKTVDDQHKKLFELAKRASLMGHKHASREDIREILADFFEYMKVHFDDEEKYMESVGYPDLEEHKKLHKHIIKELATTIVNIKNINDMKEKLGIISQEWLLEHILHQDMLVAKYYKAKNVLDAAAKPQSNIEDIPIVKEKKVEKKKEGYYYSCMCDGKIHIIPENIHNKIQNGASYKCKLCGEAIKYTNRYYFELN